MSDLPPLFTLFYAGAFIIGLIGGLTNIHLWFTRSNSRGVTRLIFNIIFSRRILTLIKALILGVLFMTRLRHRSSLRGVMKAAFVICYILLIVAYHIKAENLSQLEGVNPLFLFFYAPFADYYFLRDATPATFTATDAFFGLMNDLFAAYIVCYVVFAVFRRFIAKKVPIKSTLEDVLSDILLGSWFVFKFAAVAATILAFDIPSSIAQYWFVAYGFSMLFAPLDLPWMLLYDSLWPLSGLFFGLLIAYIPFSKLWHLIVAPLSILRSSLITYTAEGVKK